MELARKLKLALDESRLLILGAEILFGFQFQMVFQEAFQTLPTSSQFIGAVGLLLMVVAVALLIAPSMVHQLLYGGEDRRGALSVAHDMSGLGSARSVR